MGVTLLVIACSVGLAWRIYGQRGQTRIEGGTIGLPGWVVRASANKWYVDEIYEALVIRPIHFLSRSLLWAVVDVLIIDGLVNGVAAAVRKVGQTYSRVVHVGQVQAYALAITLGSLVLVFLFAFGGHS